MSSTPPKAAPPVAGVANVVPATKKVLIGVERIKELPFWSTYRLGVIGAPASGKTRLFATLSKHWAEDENGAPQPTYLDDLLFCQFDQGGINCIREWGVDGRVIPFDAMSDSDIFSALPDLPKFLVNEVSATPTRAICIDTGSRLIGSILNVLIKRGLDKAPLYNTLAMEVKKFLDAMRIVPCPIVWNFHIKPPPILDGGDDAGVRLAAGLGSSDLEMKVAGREAKDLIRDSCTHIYHLETKEMPGGKTVRQLTAASRVESKMRMQRLMTATEPANLRAFFEKLALSIKVPLP